MPDSKKKKNTDSTSNTAKDISRLTSLKSIQNSQTAFLESHLMELEQIKLKIQSFNNEYYTKNKQI